MKHAFGKVVSYSVILVWWNMVEMVEYGEIRWNKDCMSYGGLFCAWTHKSKQWQVNMCESVPRNLAGENL